MNVSKETYELFHALRHQCYANLFYNSLVCDGKVSSNAKRLIRLQQNRIHVNITEIRLLVPQSDRDILNREMLDPNVASQFQNINDMLTELTVNERDQVEQYIESMLPSRPRNR